MVQGGMSVVKFLVFAFNFVFVVCGIALIVVGAIVKTSGQPYTEFLENKFLTVPTIIITLGCIVFFIAFLGCWGALRQNHCMIMTFGILLFLIFIVEIAAGIAAYVYKSDLDELVKKNMISSLKNTHPNSSSIWNDMEHSLECCGVNNASDYKDLPNWNETVALGEVSKYCCKQVAQPCMMDEAFKKGCYEEIKTEMKSKIGMVGGAGIGIAVIEVLGMIFAWCLASAIKKEYEGV